MSPRQASGLNELAIYAIPNGVGLLLAAVPGRPGISAEK